MRSSPHLRYETTAYHAMIYLSSQYHINMPFSWTPLAHARENASCAQADPRNASFSRSVPPRQATGQRRRPETGLCDPTAQGSGLQDCSRPSFISVNTRLDAKWMTRNGQGCRLASGSEFEHELGPGSCRRSVVGPFRRRERRRGSVHVPRSDAPGRRRQSLRSRCRRGVWGATLERPWFREEQRAQTPLHTAWVSPAHLQHQPVSGPALGPSLWQNRLG